MYKTLLFPVVAVAAVATAGFPLPAQTPESPIQIGQSVRGTIGTSDPKLEDGTNYDSWRFRGRAGQTVEIVMESADFDAFLILRDAPGETGTQISTNDDGAGGTNARIIATLRDQDYWISANTLQTGESGAYTLRIATTTRVAARPPVPFSGSSVAGRLETTDPMADDDSYYDHYSYQARAGERVVIDLTSEDFDAYLAVGRMENGSFSELETNDDDGGGTNARLEFTFPAAGEYVIRANSLNAGETGAYTLRLAPSTRAATAPAAPARPVRAGETLTGTLSASDPEADDGTYYDEYAYDAQAGERVVIDLISSDFDAYLVLGERRDGDFDELASNDDNQDGGTGSSILYTFRSAGQYLIRANSIGKETGAYALTVRSLGR